MRSTFLFILWIMIVNTAQAQRTYDFSTITSAFQTFLNEDMGKLSGEYEQNLADFWHLSSFASNSIVANPANKYQTIHICNYDYYGKEIPVTYQHFVLDNFGNSKDLFINGYYFVTYSDASHPDGINLIINVSRDSVVVYAQNSESQFALNFINQLRRFEVEFNPYRSAILDIQPYPDWPYRSVFRFMDNVGNLNTSWDDLILEKDLKELSFDTTQGFLGRLSLYKELKIDMKKGVLLAGPPGTGKSFLGQILIDSILRGDLKKKATMFVVSARHLSDVSRVRLLYSGARRLAPSTVFMEDIDLLGIKNRDSNQSGEENFDSESRLNELLNGIDGLIDANHILTIGTTNRIDYVDLALSRSMRLGQHIWYGLPSFEERREFFNRFGLKTAVWDPMVTDIWLAGQTENMSGSDIIEIIRLAKKEAFLANSWQGDKLLLTQQYFLAAIALLKEEHSSEGLRTRISISNYTRALQKLKYFDYKLRSMDRPAIRR